MFNYPYFEINTFARHLRKFLNWVLSTPPSNETARTKVALSVKNDVDEEIKIRLAGISRTGGTICTDG